MSLCILNSNIIIYVTTVILYFKYQFILCKIQLFHYMNNYAVTYIHQVCEYAQVFVAK